MAGPSKSMSFGHRMTSVVVFARAGPKKIGADGRMAITAAGFLIVARRRAAIFWSKAAIF
jgi:hypothetical protein